MTNHDKLRLTISRLRFDGRSTAYHRSLRMI